jgi:hypothetical protein
VKSATFLQEACYSGLFLPTSDPCAVRSFRGRPLLT